MTSRHLIEILSDTLENCLLHYGHLMSEGDRHGRGQLLKQARLHLAEPEFTWPAWIPTSERLPEDNEDVCVHVKSFGVSQGYIERRLDEPWYWVVDGHRRFALSEVTHWVPLITPPTD